MATMWKLYMYAYKVQNHKSFTADVIMVLKDVAFRKVGTQYKNRACTTPVILKYFNKIQNKSTVTQKSQVQGSFQTNKIKFLHATEKYAAPGNTKSTVQTAQI